MPPLGPPAVQHTLGSGAGRPIYVAPNGRPDADGSIDHPLDLTTALAAGGVTNPGDTVWLRSGIYRGNFVSGLRGAESAPIMVRSYPGERVTVTTESNARPALTVNGAWTWYSGFEITSTDPQRESAEVQNVSIRHGTGVDVAGSHLKFIDLAVHDLEGGFTIAPDADDVELYGNLIYYNGWQRADGVGEGHGITSPNQSSARFIRDNVIFDQFSHGIQSFGGHVENLYIEGNTLFDNGGIAKYLDRNLLIGGGARNVVLTHNMTYYSGGPAAAGEGVNIGLGGDCSSLRIVDNYLTGSNPLNLTDCRPSELRGNTLYGRFDGSYAQRYSGNTWTVPTTKADPAMNGVKTMVRPNQYEPGRATIVVYNWDRLPTVSVDLSQAGLKSGEPFEIRNAQNYFGDPVATGTYHGGAVSLPMRGLPIAAPAGAVTQQPPATLPEFGVFVAARAAGDGIRVPTTAAR